jgi:N-acyl-D-aspartate/D-glutamate deacylase
MIGNCSLSAALTDSEEDLLDLFCRVENMPKEIIKDWLQGKITWRTVTEYYDHLEKLPIGPNIATLLGHSNLRAHVMGLSRSLNEDATKKDIDEMKEILKQALEIGYFGLSIDLLPFHKMTGTRFEGIPIPSQRASFGEYMQLASVVRKFGALLQATPNALHIHTVAFLLFLSTSFLSKRLKTTILASLDVKVCRYAPM